MTTQQLLGRLQEDAKAITEYIRNEVQPASLHILNQKPSADRWSAIECIEHLNRYHSFYLDEIERALSRIDSTSKNEAVKYSWLGKKFITMMEPSNSRQHKTLKHMNPSNSVLPKNTVEVFLNGQARLQALLQQAESKNINAGKVRLEFFRIIRLTLPECMEFLVVHQQRHINQIRSTLGISSSPAFVV